MNTLELIKDAALHGGTVPSERAEEVRGFLAEVKKTRDFLGIDKKEQPDVDLEKQALEATATLWNILILLKEVHPDDMTEHKRDIHNIQNRIMARNHPSQKWSKDGN
jgi:hypothetical protein